MHGVWNYINICFHGNIFVVVSYICAGKFAAFNWHCRYLTSLAMPLTLSSQFMFPILSLKLATIPVSAPALVTDA